MALKKTTVYHGAPAVDERPVSAQMRDFRHEELAKGVAAAPTFREKSVEELRWYENRDQDGSSTCMNQAYAKLKGILMAQRANGKYVSLSGGYAYRRRRTQGEGMALWDIFELGKQHGLPFEVIDPSQLMSEKAIMNAKEMPYADEVAKLFTDPDEAFVYIYSNYFDTIAAQVNAGNPVLIMQYAQGDEYNIIPKIKNSKLTVHAAPIRHGVCIVDTVRYKGVDYLVQDESWGTFNADAPDAYTKALKKRGQRLLSREWVEKRLYGAGYITKLNYAWQSGVVIPTPVPTKPKHTFLTDLEWGMENTEVKWLQDCLKYEGVFPVGQSSTGAYYGITMKAVQDFQVKYGIVMSGAPDTTGFGRVGPNTRKKLNQLYG